MFCIGDKIVYPMHGAGTIDAIEIKEVLGEKHEYYIVSMPIGNMKVMIPVLKVEEIGIREIVNGSETESILEVFDKGPDDEQCNWNKRYRENMVKIKSGNIYEVAEVVKNLMIRDKDKGLSTGERKMLASARKILVSELILACDNTQDEIETEIENRITG